MTISVALSWLVVIIFAFFLIIGFILFMSHLWENDRAMFITISLVIIMYIVLLSAGTLIDYYGVWE